MLKAMELPGLTKRAGARSVIRVVTCFPAETVFDRAFDPDREDHPLAKLNLGTVTDLVGKEEPLHILEVVRNEVREAISNKAQDDIEAREDEIGAALGEYCNEHREFSLRQRIPL